LVALVVVVTQSLAVRIAFLRPTEIFPCFATSL
jgi:hypothetical protein